MTRIKELLRDRHLRPLLDFLMQGLTPEKMALCIALGVALGIFPVIGSTTLLCFLVGLAARVNQPALQSTNFSVYPLQVVLLIPFFRLGERLFNVPPLPISIEGVYALIASGPRHAIPMLWNTTLRAIVAWMLVAPAVGLSVYFVVLPFLRKATPPKSVL